MSEEKKHNISPKLEHVVKGIFLVLISVILAINVGKIARTFAFPFIYFFGISSYLIYLLLFVRGIYHIVFKKTLRIKNALLVIGLIFLGVGLSLVVGYSLFVHGGLSYSNGVIYNIDRLNWSLSTYYQSGFLNIFQDGTYWNTGLVGVSLCSLIGNDGVVLSLGIIFMIAAIILIGIKPVIKLVKKHKGNKKEEKPQVEQEEKHEEIVPIFVPEPKEEENEVPFGYEVEPEIEVTPYGEISSLDDTYASRELKVDEYSEFTRLEFNEKEKAPASLVKEEKAAPIADSFAPEEREIENEEMEIPPFDDYNLEENYVELAPNKPQVDESLVKQKPEFEEPVPIPNPAFEKPVVKEEPVKKKERVKWVPPSTDLLEVYEVSEAIEANSKAAEARQEAINGVFESFGIGAKCVSYTIGSSVTRFNIEYEANVSMKSVEKIITDIAVRLGGLNVRFSPIVEGETFSGLEIPNVKITTVSFKEAFESLPDVKKHQLAVPFGKNISGKIISADFDEFPHLLVAGTTGSGKSIYTHSIVASLIMRVSPDDLKIVLVDPKRVEMTKYREMPHLLCPIITEADKAKVMLTKLVDEMNNRYQTFSDADECSNIKQYNEWAKENNKDLMPYILVVIDEYADLVDNCKDISQPVVSIAQKARAAGIHMLISTQRPSTSIITGVIKGNLPTHVALMTADTVSSITIIGEGGAEKLLGKGDMLVQSPLVSRVGVTRLQGCFIQNKEIARIVGYLKEHYPTDYDENYLDLVDHSKEVAKDAIADGSVEKEADAAQEAKYQSIKEWVMTQSFVSMSKIQRECGVGFNRAGRFFNRLQAEGIVAKEQDGTTKGCKVLVHDDFSSSYDDVGSDELTRY